MSLLAIAFKNVRHRALSYAAFFLESSLAVWMLFLYSWLLDHPAMQEIVRSNNGSFLRMTQLITAVFSVFFLFQAHGSFLRARQKELGVLTMLGLLPAQIGALIRWENLIIGAGATLLGIIGGNVCARLFGLLLMAILRTGTELPYYFSVQATMLCLLLFPLMMRSPRSPAPAGRGACRWRKSWPGPPGPSARRRPRPLRRSCASPCSAGRTSRC